MGRSHQVGDTGEQVNLQRFDVSAFTTFGNGLDVKTDNDWLRKV